MTDSLSSAIRLRSSWIPSIDCLQVRRPTSLARPLHLGKAHKFVRRDRSLCGRITSGSLPETEVGPVCFEVGLCQKQSLAPNASCTSKTSLDPKNGNSSISIWRPRLRALNVCCRGQRVERRDTRRIRGVGCQCSKNSICEIRKGKADHDGRLLSKLEREDAPHVDGMLKRFVQLFASSDSISGRPSERALHLAPLAISGSLQHGIS